MKLEPLKDRLKMDIDYIPYDEKVCEVLGYEIRCGNNDRKQMLITHYTKNET